MRHSDARTGRKPDRTGADSIRRQSESSMCCCWWAKKNSPLRWPAPASSPRSSQGEGPPIRRDAACRQLDLQTRLWRYPCSFLIYSEAFDRLPAPLSDRVWQRIWEVLTGVNTAEKYQHLSPDDRQNILAILRETKPNLPASWRFDTRASPQRKTLIVSDLRDP